MEIIKQWTNGRASIKSHRFNQWLMAIRENFGSKRQRGIDPQPYQSQERAMRHTHDSIELDELAPTLTGRFCES